ncbi:MAG: hypothetical protein ACOCZ2_00895 [Thermodesulfobacteriota bacterium]
MQKIPFILKHLSIYKMPGFPKGLPAYSDFSPHINIIAGANASGKSSTARIAQELIWRSRDRDIQAEGSFAIDTDSWEIKLDAGNVRVQKNGTEEQLSGLPAAENRGRYMLALHELVREDEQDLAKQIVQESIGGYDLDLAEKNLGYSDTVRSKSSSEYKRFQEADEHYRQLLREQRDLRKQEERLEQLYAEKENARRAFVQKDLYEGVVDYLQARREYESLEQQFRAYPDIMEKLDGRELNRVRELEDEMGEAEEEINRGWERINACRRELEKLELPEQGISDKMLLQVQELGESLADLEQRIGERDQKIAEFEAKSEHALDSAGVELDPETWKGINLSDIGRLEEFLLKAQQTLSEKQFLEAGIKELEQEIAGKKQIDSDKVREGIRILSHWLQEQKRIGGVPAKWLLVLSVLGSATAVVTLFAGWPGLLGIVVLILFTLYFYIKDPVATDSEVRKDDYRKTGLGQPVEWNIQEVSHILQGLVDDLQEARSREQLKNRWSERKKDLENLQDRLNSIEQTHKEWMEKLNAAPELPKDNLRNYSGLYSFLVDVKNWQQVYLELQAARRQKQILQEEHCRKLHRINELFKECSAGEAKESSEARAILRKLQEEARIQRENSQEMERQEESIKKSQQRLEKSRHRLGELYHDLDLEWGDKQRLENLLQQLEDYRQLREDYRLLQNRLAEKQARMQGHSMYEACRDEMAELSLDQAMQKARELEEQSERLDEIKDEIREIESSIGKAEKSSQIEDALMNKESALDDLEGLYRSNLSSITGKCILDRLRRETREQNRPAVFGRANEIFNTVTSGRYELRLQEGEPPAFSAYDTVLRLGQDLQELSTGTRVQLLIAVRLAFIENLESWLKIPVIADELLANSDDIRAGAIIDALIGISKQGRQVFYMTAQGDEVAKWRSYLDAAGDMDYRIKELSGMGNESLDYSTKASGSVPLDLEQKDLPSPGDKTHTEYGGILQVPGFDILTQDVQQMHLWYLLEDNRLLYTCLKKNLKYWGQLESFLEHGETLPGFDVAVVDNLRKKAKLLQRFQGMYRKGRPLPIDRSVLIESDAVSDKFIDEVSSKLEELGRDPEKLVQALYKGEVQRFKRKKAEELEQFLIDQGYLAGEDRMSDQEIFVQLQVQVSNLQVGPDEAERLIQRVLPQ